MDYDVIFFEVGGKCENYWLFLFEDDCNLDEILSKKCLMYCKCFVMLDVLFELMK